MVMDPVVISGLGVVDAAGLEADDLVRDLALGRRRITAPSDNPSHFARRVDDEALIRQLTPRRARRMSRPSRFAVAAAEAALAGGRVDEPAGITSVAIATTFGPLSYTEKLLDQMHDEGATAASPALFTECVANAPAAQVSIATGATGANIAICQREAGPLIAVGVGCSEIAQRRADRALVGCTDEVTGVQHDVLSRFHALSGAGNDTTPNPRPFDLHRDGFLLAEGSAMLLCERPGVAEARQVQPLAKIVAHGSAFDPSASRAGWGRGAETLARSLSAWLHRNAIAPDTVDLIVCGASGSIAGDRLEGQMLHSVWEHGSMPPVIAPKAVTGEYGGGFLAAAVLAAQGRWFPAPTAGQPDAEIGVRLTDTAPTSPPRRTLVTSCAAGGAAAWVLLEAL